MAVLHISIVRIIFLHMGHSLGGVILKEDGSNPVHGVAADSLLVSIVKRR